MRKIELFRVGSTSIESGLVPYAGGIYWKKMSVSDTIRAASPITTIFGAEWNSSLSSDPIEITGVSFNNIALSEVSSIAELYSQEGSFYFDLDNQDLYIALFDYRNFQNGETLQVGVTIGFLNRTQWVDINGKKLPLDTFIGTVFYEPRLETVSVIDKVDDQKNGIFVYGSLNAGILNTDGRYDELRESVVGNQATLLIANIADSEEEALETGFPYKDAAELSDFRISRVGIVRTIDYSNPNKPVIKATDKRADWSQTIGTSILTTEEFPNLPEKYVNKLKPVCIGPINGVSGIPVQATNEIASTPFDYLICDTSIGAIQSISAVYFRGQLDTGSGSIETDRFLVGGEYSVDFNTGILTVNNCLKGDVWVYGGFTNLDESVEILLFLLNEYANFAYLDSNFNKTEVEQIRSLNYETHVYITEKGQQLRKIIEKLCDDIKCDFIQQGDVFTLRQANAIRSVTEAIPSYQIIDNPPSWNTNRADTIKTISVGYNKDYRLDLFTTYVNTSKEKIALDNNLEAIDKEFETNLVHENDITEIYDAYYTRFIKVPRTVTIKRTTAFLARVGDFISFSVVRKNRDLYTADKVIFDDAIYKIIQINETTDTVIATYFEDSGVLPIDPPLPPVEKVIYGKLTAAGLAKYTSQGVRKLVVLNPEPVPVLKTVYRSLTSDGDGKETSDNDDKYVIVNT